jgi:hypothetical protein
MATMAQRIIDLATRISTECKSIRTLTNGNAADLSALATTQKGNLVAAMNELKGLIDGLSASSGAQINDAATATTTTWSSTKISSDIAAAINALTTGAPGALNTLDELATALGDDANFAATITTALANRVRVDAAQALTLPQQAQGRANLGAQEAALIGDPDTNYVTTFNTGLV